MPRSILLLSGPSGSAYQQYGERYADFLRDKGLAVEVVITQGSLDNLERLKSEQRADV